MNQLNYAGALLAFVVSVGTACAQAAETTTQVTSNANPSVFGQSVTFTATVTAVAPGAGAPTGAVSFFDGSNVIGTRTLNGVGQATFVTSSLCVGTHSILAGHDKAAGSHPNPMSQTVTWSSSKARQ